MYSKSFLSLKFIFLGLFFLLTVFITPFMGMSIFNPLNVFGGHLSLVDHHIFYFIRVPRVMVSFLCGACLAQCGMAFQAMFKNPLATPFTLGVSGGASFGASLYILLGGSFSIIGISGVTIAAFFGALLSIFIVYGLTRACGGFSSGTILLAGVAISFFFSSAIFFMQYISDFTQSFRILRWLMGGLEVHGYSSVFEAFSIVASGTLILLYFTHALNLLATGEEEAIAGGLNIKLTMNTLFFTVSLMMAAVISICGPIGFVGMMVPHICRLMVGANHMVLTPATILFGGCFLTWCDTLSRVLIAPAEIPVGIITALLGGPFFLWLLISKKGFSEF